MKKNVFILVIISMLAILPSINSLRTNIIDELQLITVVGFDQEEGDLFRGTATVGAYSIEEEMNNATLSAVSSSTRQLRLLLNAMSSRPIHGGKISAIVVQDKLAEEGIFALLDTYYRDPTIALKSFLCVTKGDAHTMLSQEYPLQTEIGTYLSDMLDHNIRFGNLPLTNMHLFMRAYYEKGKDPIMPMLSYTDEFLRIDGLALFKKDQFVVDIDLKEAFYLKLIKDGYQNGGVIEISLNEGEEVAVLREIRSKLDLDTDLEKNVLKANLEIKTRISEYSGGSITEERITEIVKAATENITSGIEGIISLMQEHQIDPVGFGARQLINGDMDEDEWYDIFQQMEIDVEVDVNIVESGVSQ
ncbi:Ger(x)C family spore germination protein [Shouchella sp. JSM 1781072]|uniref:Ger(x)C family spore germination protein n=1 Tax=Bacillaceae TaxID=186817 RepID=UPI000C08D4CD|nr:MULTISPECIES: Ger(x)C family spore germination protein [Bacillaceae]UTR06239.1 Ger(x)C family spore germination protein [Alkalihalobacillus sp. LMS6]